MKNESQALSETERTQIMRELRDRVSNAESLMMSQHAIILERDQAIAAKDAALEAYKEAAAYDGGCECYPPSDTHGCKFCRLFMKADRLADKALSPDAGKGWMSPDRTSAIQWCLSEVLRWHSNPQSPDYNECEKAPCHWCAVARELVGETNCGAQPASNLEQPPVAVPG